MQTFTQHIQTPLFKRHHFMPFWNLHEMENIFEKKGESSSLSISEIIDSKRGGYLSAWKALLEQLSVINLLTGSKHCLNLHGDYYLIFPWVWDKLSWKKSALVRSKILGLFVNTLTAEHVFSSQYADFHANRWTPLSLKQKTFSGFFILTEIYMKWRTFSKKRRVF